MKVLIVDDDPSFLEISKTFLEVFHNIPSDTVGSAKEALNMLEKDSYDVIVSDYDMPVMNGIMFLKTIRNKKINTPFILFTGVGEELMHQAIQSGANSFMLKTSDPKTQYLELSKQIWKVTTKSTNIGPNF
ncbi:response regulator [Methanosarcina hadiensis]|uniref:response regulator n=1 Tax=Methanosarcina hadiensis TaxID=3078083 RepID=UPI00397736C5